MFQYTFSKLQKLGDYDETYGQRYWAEVTEELKPVMFNSKDASIEIGDMIEAAETSNRRSGKGVDYLMLKKVRTLKDRTEQQEIIANNPYKPQPGVEALINQRLDEIMSFLTDIRASVSDLMSAVAATTTHPDKPATGRASTSWQQAKARLQPPDEPPEYGEEDMPL